MPRTARLSYPAEGLGDDIVYRFIDSDGSPLDLGDRRVAVSVRTLTPVRNDLRTFITDPEVIRKTDTANGEVTISWNGFLDLAGGMNLTLTDPGSYELVIWAYEATTYPDTPDEWDYGLWDDSDWT